MAIDLIWWRDEPVLEYICSGEVTGEELLARNREALSDARFPGIRLQLCDMERVEDFRITPAQVRTIVEIDREAAKVAPGMERLAIASTQDLIYGFSRMYQITLGGEIPAWEVGSFRTRREALDWLGMHPHEEDT